MAFEEYLMPEVCEPGVPGEDGWWLPRLKIFSPPPAVEVQAKGAGGALVAGDDGAAATDEFVDVVGQAAKRLHLSFIRFAGEWKSWSAWDSWWQTKAESCGGKVRAVWVM